MATKNLSRTVIEGGRTGSYKAECSKRMSEERAAWRSHAKAIVLDPESYDEESTPKRRPVYPQFADKLAPIYRFLESKLGESWDDVRSELFQKFDTRTTPGRHVLFDHLLKDVQETPEPDPSHFGYRRFFRDEGGILRLDERWNRRTWYPQREGHRVFDLRAVAQWLGPMKVGRAGAGFARYIAGGKLGHLRIRAVAQNHYELAYAWCDAETGKPIFVEQPPSTYTNYKGMVEVRYNPPKLRIALHGFRQDGMLEGADEAYMRSLPTFVQKMVTVHAPANF